MRPTGQWVMRPDPAIHFLEGETAGAARRADAGALRRSLPGAARCCTGRRGAEGRGALLTGDIINVVADRRYVSFMYSYPNLIPLPAPAVRRIWAAVEPFAYDRIYGAWWHRTVAQDGREAVRHSADRYIRAIGGTGL